MLKKTLQILMLVLWVTVSAQGQQIGIWESQTAKSTVNLIEVDKDGLIWCATEGGLFVVEDGVMIEQYTPAEGMHRVNPSAMTYDSFNHRIWLGYIDGSFEFYDIESGRFRLFNDITRAEQYNPRGINTLKMRDESLYIATDFGIVVYNTMNLSTRETYFNLGEFSAGTRVQDILFKDDLMFAATPVGVAIGDLNSDNLEVPSNWSNHDETTGLAEPNIRVLGLYSGNVYASSDETYMMGDENWSEADHFGQVPINSFITSSSGSYLIAVSNEVIYKLNDGVEEIEASDGVIFNTGLLLDDHDQLLFGTTSMGLGIIEDGQTDNIYYLMPSGPYLNFFAGLNYDNGTIISGSSFSPGRVSIPIQTTGYYIFKDDKWYSYNVDTNEKLRQDNFKSSFTSSFTDDYYFFGSWGHGLARHHKENNDIEVFNTQNSPLQGFQRGSNFIVVSGLSSDDGGDLWVISWQHEQGDPLYRFNPATEEWTVFPPSSETFNADTYFDIMVDSYDQKWITLRSTSEDGRGLLVLQTEGDENGKSVRLTEGNEQIPHNSVNALVQDRNGEVWIGTDRGVVRFPFPDRIIDGTIEDRRGSQLINADTTAESAFLLSTINATAIAVNAANDKWIGTEDDGLWLIAESGGRYQVKHHFTTDNSPLISDNITSLTVDDEIGRVFIATEEGLVTYTDVTRRGESDMADLFIYPNPFSYLENEERVIIDGLSDRGKVRIISVDGRLVDEFETQGGRVEWQVRDYNGNRVATGVYLVIAVDEQSGERGSGKVVIIR